MSALLFLIAKLAVAQSAEEERSFLQAKLFEEKQSLVGLAEDRAALSEVLSFLEFRAKSSLARRAELERQAGFLSRRLSAAERRVEWAQKRVFLQAQKLGPALVSRYRLERRNPLDVLLSSQDLESLLRTQRALSQVLAEDLEELRDLQRAAKAQQWAMAQLDRLKISLFEKRDALEAQAEAEADQRNEVKDLLSALKAQAQNSSRHLEELDHAERQLTRLLAERPKANLVGFAALFGKLPFPTLGQVEVSFGKVVQARTGTAVWQKGVDIRAAKGAPVKAIARGVVAYAGRLRGYGPVLIVDHFLGFHSVMAHLSSMDVKFGDKIQAGQILGAVGDEGSEKGAYLHFQIREQGLAVDPVPWFASNP